MVPARRGTLGLGSLGYGDNVHLVGQLPGLIRQHLVSASPGVSRAMSDAPPPRYLS